MYIPFNVRWCYTFQIAIGGGEYSGSTSHSYTLCPGHPSSKCVQHHKESNINFVVLVTTYFLLEVGNGPENILSRLFFQLSLLLSNIEAVSSHKWQNLNTTWLPLLDHEAELVFNDLWNGNILPCCTILWLRTYCTRKYILWVLAFQKVKVV